MAKKKPASKKKPQAPRRKPAATKPASKKTAAGKALPIEIDPKRIEQTLGALKNEVRRWANKGRFTKVRFKFRGKQLLPDLPLAAVMAAEGLTFYWGGILRALLFNVAGKAVLDVELINDAEKEIHRGKQALLTGDLAGALAAFREAVAMDRDSPSAHLNLGVALKLSGDLEGARGAFSRARALDPEGAVGAEAEKLIGSVPASPSP